MKHWAQPSGVLVLGAGKTGVSAVRFFLSRRTPVFLVDRCPEPLAAWSAVDGVQTCLESEAMGFLDQVDLLIPSPGVPRDHPILTAALRSGQTVWSEIELASRLFQAPVLAVTGTNGKSTTTTLLGAMLQNAGLRTFVGGNLGTPFLEATQGCWQAAVVEVSSFQLEWVDTFRPTVGVFLNLTPDHLDRYQNLDDYGRTKLRLFANQREQDWAVYFRDDPWVKNACETGLRGRTCSFGWQPVELGAWAEGDRISFRLAGAGEWLSISLSRTRLTGKHNVENIMAASLAAVAFGVPLDAVQRAVDEVEPLPHRLEFVREWRGVRFYDDSKGTNVGATAKALSSFDEPVVLLAGGYDKGSSFRVLARVLQEHVRFAVFFGAAAEKWAREVGHVVPHEVARSLREAVSIAARVARAGEVVLLSPGCASFDEFQDYADRGRSYRAWVEAL